MKDDFHTNDELYINIISNMRQLTIKFFSLSLIFFFLYKHQPKTSFKEEISFKINYVKPICSLVVIQTPFP